jgi:hypothetical protein
MWNIKLREAIILAGVIGLTFGCATVDAFARAGGAGGGHAGHAAPSAGGGHAGHAAPSAGVASGHAGVAGSLAGSLSPSTVGSARTPHGTISVRLGKGFITE